MGLVRGIGYRRCFAIKDLRIEFVALTKSSGQVYTRLNLPFRPVVAKVSDKTPIISWA